MLNITLTANVAIAGGPSILFEQTINDADCYQVVDLDLPAGTVTPPLEVQLQPGSAMALLVITADSYSEPPETVTYSTTNTAGAPLFALSQPVLLLGDALLALGATQPQTLYFRNPGSAIVRVKLLVVRDATPTPAP